MRFNIPPGKVRKYGQHRVGLRSLRFLCGVDDDDVLEFLKRVLRYYRLPRNIDGAIDLMIMAMKEYQFYIRIAEQRGLNQFPPSLALDSFLCHHPGFPDEWYDITETQEHLEHLRKGRNTLRRGIQRGPAI